MLKGLTAQLSRFREIATFALVGGAASIVHLIAVIVLHEQFHFPAWQANILAFLCALPVSYLGHSYLTFTAKNYGREGAVSSKSFMRFVSSAASGFALNQLCVVIFIEQLGFPSRVVFVLTVFGVAGFLFLASKFWAFKK